MTALDLVYQYRTLLGKCEAGVGLDMDEVVELTALEAAFAAETAGPRRERTDLTCILRGAGHGDLNDCVRVGELAPGGLICRQAPYVDEGTVVEVVIDDADASLSYRFKARVTWLREDVGDDFALGLAFLGSPLLIHYGPTDHAEDAVDRIAAAA
jgi:hypothetical protein